MPVKKALLVGCNYPGTNAELRGCVNDVMAMKDLLIKYKGFSAKDIRTMIDTDSSSTRPTGEAIRYGLLELVSGAGPGDVLVFHFSGHGTQIPASGPDREEDGKDEAIVPTDMALINDDDLKEIFGKLPPDAHLTVICDCCHSGSMLDHAAVQIEGSKTGGGGAAPTAGGIASLFALLSSRGIEAKNRSLDVTTLAQVMSQQYNRDVRPDNIHSSMFDIFGTQSGSIVHRAMGIAHLAMTAKAAASGGAGAGGTRGGLLMRLFGMCSSAQSNTAMESTSSAPGSADGTGPYIRPGSLGEDTGVLITGCQAHETSADACPGGDPTKAFGALTNTLTTIVKQNPEADYYTVVRNVRVKMAEDGFAQNPSLECSSSNARRPFIC